MSDLQFSTYGAIGVRPLINCRGYYTILSGSLLLPEVRAAMTAASRSYVHLDELAEAVGGRIAELMECEWGLVVNGCAAALAQVTAAAVAGGDPEKIARLPDTTGMKNEVIVQPSHRHVYDHAVRAVGVKMVEVRTREELENAAGDCTAMLLMKGDVEDLGEISVAEMAACGKARGIPSFVDAAAERPDVPNRYLADGVDAVAYSGGKCLLGPQSSGLVLGRKALLQAAFLNGAPHHSIGRPMKAGKEEVMGLLAAVEQWVARDHESEWREWERRLATVAAAVEAVGTVATSIRQPGRSNVAPILDITWDSAAVGISPGAVERELSAGDPRIELSASGEGVTVASHLMEEGEDEIVARRLAEVLGAG